MKLIILISFILCFLKCHSVNVYSQLDHESQEVTRRLHRIMVNPGISTKSKRYLESALENLNNGVEQALGWSVAHPTDHPNRARGRRSIKGQLHATECCCKVNVPPKRTIKRYTVTKMYVAHRYTKLYTDCGLFLLWTCTKWRVRYYQKPYTVTKSYSVYTPQPCPSNKEVCCRGYLSYKKCCTHVKEMKRLLDLFDNQRAQFENNIKRFLVSHGNNPHGQCPKSCGPE
ncbi:unnamed protein product [Owenia fusiformis]|uniref:Uncharacterized protein n=1 Tax=Owenia fusiformis TaxID=6347 RepID=A0A8J1TQW1_OWEFU|nr:unnamed protein product [Owenia fusiformis]